MVILYEENNLLIPAYALSSIVNDDNIGIDESDEDAINNYMGYYYDKAKKLGGMVIFSPGDDEAKFSNRPEFGLPCDCIRCTIIIVKY